MLTTSLATLGLLASSPLWAQADEAGVARLLAVFQTYLGSTEGVVAVAVSGDAYAVTIDATPMLSAIPVPEMTAAMSPIVLQMTDNGDGTWAYQVDQAVTIDYNIDGQMSANTTYSSVKLDGEFDEALGDSTSYTVEIVGVTSEQSQTDPNLGAVAISTKVDRMTGEGEAVAGAESGTVDSTFTFTTQGMTYSVVLPMGEGAPSMAIDGTIAEGAADGSMTGYKPAAFYGMIAWLVAHPNEEAMMADKAGLRAQLEASMPFFGNISVNAIYSAISVDSPLGVFGLDQAGIEVEANGLVSDGLFRETVHLKGLSLPPGIAPPYAEALIPDEFTIDVAASKFDPAAAATLALTLFDLPEGAEPPDGFEMHMLAAILPEGAVDITLAPGGLSNDIYALSYEGQMSAGMDGMPVGTATITLSGGDEIMATLDGAPPEISGQAIMMLGMAQGMGTPGPDGETVWEIDASTPGSLKINGVDMMGMP
jgi:hypothetical protein